MEIRQLKTFQMVARTLSFSKTAEALSYAQSTITAQIQSLEEELGLPLFDRMGRHITLTDAGQQLLAYARQITQLEEEARAAVSSAGLNGGTVTIGAPETILTYRLPRVLRQFQDSCPKVKLQVRPYASIDLFSAAKNGEIDVVFTYDQEINTPELETVRLTSEKMVLVAAPEHELTQMREIQTADLVDQAILFTEPGCHYRLAFEYILQGSGIRADETMVFYSVEALKQCVVAGLGIALMPEVAVRREVAEGRLLVLPWQQAPKGFHTYMAWHRSRWMSPALEAFLSVTQELVLEQEVWMSQA